ncbi:unnamed protein product [Bemisia tabaci]|uniref:CCHC-type domain-containing protein n=1 Tax=Bemisia tabaci TaxID=7038 RepID=A0AAI8UUT4_BEMTA|nr:unnamed protein product [Bemisia tabaci]
MGRRRKKRASSLSDSSELDLLQIFGVPTSNDFDDVLGIIPIQGEKLPDFIAELKNMSLKCDFDTHRDRALRDQLIIGLNDSRMIKLQSPQPKQQCFRCPRKHNQASCPARNWRCFWCKKVDHTAPKCPTLVNQIEEEWSKQPNQSTASPPNQQDEALINFLRNPNQHFSLVKHLCETSAEDTTPNRAMLLQN